MIRLLKYIVAWLQIPKGPYCDKCPYWRPDIAPILIGDRTIAYCVYLNKTDLDICKERESKIMVEVKTGREKTVKEMCEEVDLSFGSLLWDGCKECGIKE